MWDEDRKREYHREYYRRNKDKNKKKQAERTRNYYLKNKDRLRELRKLRNSKPSANHKKICLAYAAKVKKLKQDVKVKYGCMNPTCSWYGPLPPCCLDYHHIDSSSKKFNIASKSSAGKPQIIKEINKCTVLCAICHRMEVKGLIDNSILIKCNVDKDGNIIMSKNEEVTTVTLADKEIKLDTNLLKFDEHTINQFLQNFAAYYNEFYGFHANAQYVHSKYEDRYDAVYADKFKQYREDSSSDKMAEMKTKADKDVQDALDNVRLAKRNVNLLWGYLRSMDRAHEDAMQFCYNLRKEMDKIFPNFVKKIEDVIG